MQAIISSSSNERIKHARRVRDGREEGLILVEGLRLAEEALRSGLQVEAALVSAGTAEARLATLITQIEAQQAPVWQVRHEVLNALTDTVQSQGVALIARRPQRLLKDFTALPGTLFLALDRVQDPGNMGTLLRTAEAAGVSGLIALGGSVDVHSPKVLRSSMGSAFRLPLITEATADLLMQFRTGRGLCLVAAAGEGEMDYDHHDWRQPTLLLLGNDGRGVADDLLQACDKRLRIPMANGVESLNVAAAGAVMLFEAARQRRCG